MTGTTVVVGADFGETGDAAIRAGLQQLASGVAQTLHVVHVHDASSALLPREEEPARQPPDVPMVLESLSRRVRAIAQAEHASYQEGQLRVEVRTGDVLTGLLGAIRQHRADLAVVGTHGRRGLDRILTGSIAELLVRSAECAVLVARARPSSSAPADSEAASKVVPEPVSHVDDAPWRPSDVGGAMTRR